MTQDFDEVPHFQSGTENQHGTDSETPSGVIKRLSPDIANKIAAGEVVQRPSSVVKELLDNSIDAGADHIKVIIQNAGRTLIQVVDNGCGMSESDIPLCFLRHATSKIATIEDLHGIRTLGFRGEAMASIASVAQVALKTKRRSDDAGFGIEIDGGTPRGEVEPVATDDGTSISVYNLFFNVPARRAFLKTDATEFRHIMLVFQQIVLAHCDIKFELIADGQSIYNLPAQSLAERIGSMFGKSYPASLIELNQETSYAKLSGYLIDPKLAKKTRGEQFLYVNRRPFQHRHLSYVILDEYKNWMQSNQYPFFALFFEVDPESIDVNVHPSKMEVKFEEERAISTFTRSVVRGALNTRFQVPLISPADDDESDSNVNIGFSFDKDLSFPSAPQVRTGGIGSSGPESWGSGAGNSGSGKSGTNSGGGKGFSGAGSKRDFTQELYGFGPGPKSEPSSPKTHVPNEDGSYELIVSSDSPSSRPQSGKPQGSEFWQLHDRYIITQTRSGLCIIDQHLAHKRIIFEKALETMSSGLPSTQQLLFPRTIEFSATDYTLLKELRAEVLKIGFDIQMLSGNSVIVTGVPADVEIGNEKEVLESILHQFQEMQGRIKMEAHHKLALAFANRTAVPRGRHMPQEEMEALIDQLFACENPYTDPLNRPTLQYVSLEEIAARFR